MSNNRSGLIGWFATNPVAANLLMAFFLFAGLITTMTIRQEFIPEMSVEQIEITIPYPGATPKEVERQVCRKVEEALSGINGIKRVSAYASEGFANVYAEVSFRHSVNEVRQNIQQAMDGISGLPKSVERPTVKVLSTKDGIMWLIISGDLNERSLKFISTQVHEEILALPAVNQATLEGVREYEVAIEVNEFDLNRYGLTIDDVRDAVLSSSINMPLGTIRSTEGELLLRVANEADTNFEFGKIPVKSVSDGSIVRISDIGRVKDGFEETNWFLRYQGEKAAGVQVFRVGQQSIQDVAKDIHQYVEKKKQQLPAGVSLSIIADTSVPLKNQIQMMVENVVTGGLLVFVCLTLFLRMRLAFWVVAGMPVCFLGAIWAMDFGALNLSINMLTLFGFILVIGIVVDDAIVIGENVHTSITQHGQGVDQVIAGAKQVALPATFGVLTTMAAFIPIFMLPGVHGKLWGNIAWVVILCLFLSLIESKLILPAHLAHMKPVRKTAMNGWLIKLQDLVASYLQWVIVSVYRPSLHYSIRWRHSILALFIGVAIITTAVTNAGIIRFVFFPDFESDSLEVQLSMPGGTAFEVTSTKASQIEDAAKDVNTLVRHQHGIDDDVIQNLVSFSGSETDVSFYAELIPAENRPLSSKEVIKIWRKTTGEMPGASKLVFRGTEDEIEPPIDIQLTGAHPESLALAAKEIGKQLAAITGVYDINDTYQKGKKELNFSLSSSAEVMGVSFGKLTEQIYNSIYGAKVQTLQRGSEEVDVYVRFPKEARDSIVDLQEMRINSDGKRFVLPDVAQMSLKHGEMQIVKINRKRVLSITALIDSAAVEPSMILEKLQTSILPDIMGRYPGIHYTFAGQQEGQSEALKAMKKGCLIALFIIYALMAIPLRSYIQPVLIMIAIPFGIIGALWGHWLLGLPVSILSLCGIIALSGVVINDSLVMVDYVNTRRRTGRSALRAICDAGPARFRAILLTSITTFAGLVPMMLEKSLQAQFLIPMAVSLAFGILFATLITLYFIPVLYIIGCDIKVIAITMKNIAWGSNDSPNSRKIA